MIDQLPPAPQWRGINHLALVTPDMDMTTRFYAGVLGMPLVMTLMAGPMRHYFFEMAPGNTVAFFEIPDAGSGLQHDSALVDEPDGDEVVAEAVVQQANDPPQQRGKALECHRFPSRARAESVAGLDWR